MRKTEAVVPLFAGQHDFVESEDDPEGDPASPRFVQSIDGISDSPFKEPYPVQKPGGTTFAGNAGELRGFYHRSDGSDRWKPNWSTFGHPRSGKKHQGLDIYARVGTAVVAIADGYAMLYPKPVPGDELGIKVGITIRASDNKKYDVLYGHLSGVEGESRSVKKGDVIGYTGCTGNAEDGTCEAPNSCKGHSSHLHIAVRESTAGAPYLDPGELFRWRLGYADDLRDVPCNQAFSGSLVFEELLKTEPVPGMPQDLLLAGKGAVESKRFKAQSCSTAIKLQSLVGLTIYEDLEITLTVINSGPWPGVKVEISGRERHFFHPATSRQSTYGTTTSLQNLGPSGDPIGDVIHIRLTRIEGETTSDTGLRCFYASEYVREKTLDLSKPIRFMASVLEPA